MSPTPTTLIITKGRSTGLMTSHMRRMTTVITIAVLSGRTDASRVSMEPQPTFDKSPFSGQAEVALLSQNGALQGLDGSVSEEDICCRDRPLKAIDADKTTFKNGLSLRRPAIRGLNVAKYYQPHDTPCRLDVVPPVDSEMKSLCGKDVKPDLMLQHLENVQRPALAQVAVGSQNEVFGASLTAHLSSLSEGLPWAQEEFSAALVDLANTHPQDVGENPLLQATISNRPLPRAKACCGGFPSYTVETQAIPTGSEGFWLLQAWWWLLTPRRAMMGSVLTLSCPLGSPPMVSSAPSSPAYEPGVPVQVSAFRTVSSPTGVLLGHRSTVHPTPQTHHLSSSVLGSSGLSF